MDGRDLERLRQQLQQAAADEDAFLRSCAKELAARLLRKAIRRTPVGVYPSGSGKVGGTLRRGWTAERDITVKQDGKNFIVEIVNPVEYASYVEYGHRTRGHTGWVEGQFMLTISEEEVRKGAPQILEKKLEKWLKGCFQ